MLALAVSMVTGDCLGTVRLLECFFGNGYRQTDYGHRLNNGGIMVDAVLDSLL